MGTNRLFSGVCLFCLAMASADGAEPERDTIPPSKGELRITFLGHGTLMFEFAGMTIHVDPVTRYGDYSALPKADLILVTHEHGDHLDRAAIDKIATKSTVALMSKVCSEQLPAGTVMNNGDVKKVRDLTIEAVPAYNIVHTRKTGEPFHPKGAGNGYVITFGDKRVYVAGDTENVPEMARLAGVDCAFLPMNLPYTMTPEMVAAAAKMIKPKILYPYHFGETDTAKLQTLLNDAGGIEVRIRKMQ